MIYTKSPNIRQCFVFEKVLVKNNNSNNSNNSNKINKEIGTNNMAKYYPEISKIW